MNTKPRIIVVCGPTATGKSDLAVEIALKENGEVISADSRQIYAGMDIGSGKITKEEMQGVPHYLLDVADPRVVYTVSDFQRDALEKIREILARGKTPIICGGTGFYIDSILYKNKFPSVPPNEDLRKELERKTITELSNIIRDKDLDRYESIDLNNKVRLIRAIEIIEAQGKVPEIKRLPREEFDFEIHYIDRPDDVLKERISKRLLKRLDEGMIKEVEDLHKEAVTWERLEQFGLEYRFIAQYLQKKILREEMISGLESAIWKYAKRQRTWFKKYLPQK